MKQPESFEGELRPYQVKGFSWLAFLRQYGIGACLADDMGLGKTIQLLALLLKDKEDGNERPTFLYVPLRWSGTGSGRQKSSRHRFGFLCIMALAARKKSSLMRF